MIQLIRDDIYALLAHAIAVMSASDRYEQQRHITVVQESVATWRSWQGNTRGQSLYRHLEVGAEYPERMKTLRNQCQRLIKQYFERPAKQLCEALPYTLNRIHSEGTEWTGPLLRDENNRSEVKRITFDWLERQHGWWFEYQPERLRARE
jgi:hypothetical protein